MKIVYQPGWKCFNILVTVAIAAEYKPGFR